MLAPSGELTAAGIDVVRRSAVALEQPATELLGGARLHPRGRTRNHGTER